MRQHIRVDLLAGGILAAAALSARAGDDAPKPASGAPASGSYCTVCCPEWVPETYQCTRTVCRRECRQETYTAYKCVCCPETRMYECCEYKMVHDPDPYSIRRTCCCVPCVEERTVYKTCYRCVPYTTTCRKCVDRGHWECRAVQCCSNYSHAFGFNCFGRRNHCCNSCCNSCCNPCCCCVK